MKKDMNKRRFWLGHYHQWKNSGLTQEEYCHREEIPFNHFRRWRAVLAKSGDIVKSPADKQTTQFKPLILASSADLTTEQSITNPNTQGRTEIELALPGGVKLSLRSFA